MKCTGVKKKNVHCRSTCSSDRESHLFLPVVIQFFKMQKIFNSDFFLFNKGILYISSKNA